MELWVKITVWCLVVAVLSSHSEQASRLRRQGVRPTQSNGKCQTQNKETGNCINIRQCPYLLDMLTTRSKEPSVVEYLRASQCGFQGRDPHVCCPTASPGTTSNNALPGTDICGLSNVTSDKVVRGKPALLGSWPWMVALGYRSPSKPLDWSCGGSLISNRYVVTAAHCVTNVPGNRKLYLARLGELDLNGAVDDGASPVDVYVDKAIPHENYNPSLHTFDIALVRLRNTVEFSDNIRPVCLPSSTTFVNDLEGFSPYIAGWGATSFNGPYVTALQEAELEITSLEACVDAYKKFKDTLIDERVICATSPLSDACQGDSGGPLVLTKRLPTNPNKINYYLAGVVSYGYKCAEPGFPGVYTKVSVYEDWIKRNMNE